MIILADAPERIWLNVIIVIVAVLIVLAVILVPVIRRIYNKKKGIQNKGHCEACAVTKVKKPSRIKKNYDRKYRNQKKKTTEDQIILLSI